MPQSHISIPKARQIVSINSFLRNIIICENQADQIKKPYEVHNWINLVINKRLKLFKKYTKEVKSYIVLENTFEVNVSSLDVGYR